MGIGINFKGQRSYRNAQVNCKNQIEKDIAKTQHCNCSCTSGVTSGCKCQPPKVWPMFDNPPARPAVLPRPYPPDFVLPPDAALLSVNRENTDITVHHLCCQKPIEAYLSTYIFKEDQKLSGILSSYSQSYTNLKIYELSTYYGQNVRFCGKTPSAITDMYYTLSAYASQVAWDKAAISAYISIHPEYKIFTDLRKGDLFYSVTSTKLSGATSALTLIEEYICIQNILSAAEFQKLGSNNIIEIEKALNALDKKIDATKEQLYAYIDASKEQLSGYTDEQILILEEKAATSAVQAKQEAINTAKGYTDERFDKLGPVFTVKGFMTSKYEHQFLKPYEYLSYLLEYQLYPDYKKCTSGLRAGDVYLTRQAAPISGIAEYLFIGEDNLSTTVVLSTKWEKLGSNSGYALSADVKELVKTTSAITLASATTYTDQEISTLSSTLSTILTGFLPDKPVSTVLDQKISDTKDYATSIVEATSTFISGVLGEWTPASSTVASRILNIEDKIDGQEGLSTKVSKLEIATNINTTYATPIINSENKLAHTYQADIASMTCTSFDYNKIKFIGDCNVSYNTNGQIIIRIGPNQNCSIYNSTDGISDTTVSYISGTNAKTTTISNSLSSYLSAGYSRANAIYLSSYNISFSANCGYEETTLDIQGNSVHFEDPINGKIRITYGDGVTASALHTVDFDLPYDQIKQTISGFTVEPTNWKDEPKKATGATGYCVNINISWNPSATFGSKSTDFRLIQIQQLEGDSVINSWINADPKIYGYLTDITKPGTPSTASYTISIVNKKIIGGVTFLTNSSKMSPSATGLTNLAYPATTDNKINCSPVGGAWFTGFNTNNTIVGLTDAKNIQMTWNTSNINILIGQYSNPQIAVKGRNIIADGTTKNSAMTNNALLICDTNGYINNNHGSYSDSSRKDGASETIYTSRDLRNNTAGSGDLQTYNGWIQYPNKDFTSFNKVTGDTNPDYSKCTGTRSAYLKVTKSGTIMGGTFTFTCSENPETYFKNGSLKLEFVKKDGSNWRDVMNAAVGTSYKWGTTTQIGFTIDQPSDYGNGLLYIKFTMTGTTVGIGSFVLV